jgi:hypothetical protein
MTANRTRCKSVGFRVWCEMVIVGKEFRLGRRVY